MGKKPEPQSEFELLQYILRAADQARAEANQAKWLLLFAILIYIVFEVAGCVVR